MTENKFKIAKSTISFLTIASLVLAYFPFGKVDEVEAALLPNGAVGPVVVSGLGKGFPAYVMDQNGLAIELTEAADGFGISAPVNPADPGSVELGWDEEGFYWSAEAFPSNPNGLANLILALEATYSGAGTESLFGRVRIRIDVGTPGTYTVRHPFGTIVRDVATVGPGPEINETSDIGCIAAPPATACATQAAFAPVLSSDIGPFLTWDTFDIDPALSDPALVNPARPGKRYVGSPSQDHAIKGSPVGQNFFSIQGPDIGGPGVNIISTNLFGVTGRIAVVDTVAPVIASVTPTEVIVDANGAAPAATVAANISDALNVAGDPGAVRSATINLSALSNNFSATLNAAQEVPGPGNTGGSGNGTFVLDRVANTLSFNISLTGLSAGDRETTPHIHNAAAGLNGSAVFDLPIGASKVGTWNYTENLEAEILAGRMYVQIHSELFPAGAIRGQILTVPDIQNMALTAGTPVNGTWSFIVRSLPGVGTFSLPISTNDGANITNFAYPLAVTNPPPVANPDTTTIGTNIGESATIAVLVNDTDPNGNLPLSLVSVQNVSAGAAVVSGQNVIVTSPTNVFAGSITAQYTVADSLGATAVGDITVNVVRDVAPPVITLNGANPMAVVAGTPYVEPGIASVVDDFDGVLPIASVQVVSTVPAGNLVVGTGPFTVTYSISDAVGNLASVVRTVNVETPVFSSVSVAPSPLTIVIGQIRQMSAIALDQAGNPLIVQPVFTWSSANTTVASITGGGLVTGGTVGTAVMTASATVGATTLNGTSNVTVSACQTTADADGSGSIGNLEVLNHIRAWKGGTITNLEILNAIRFWKAGSGC